jgi:hypothetical protein
MLILAGLFFFEIQILLALGRIERGVWAQSRRAIDQPPAAPARKEVGR